MCFKTIHLVKPFFVWKRRGAPTFLGDFNFKRTFCGSHKDALSILKELFTLVGVLSSK